jgi:hypothetical protein
MTTIIEALNVLVDVNKCRIQVKSSHFCMYVAPACQPSDDNTAPESVMKRHLKQLQFILNMKRIGGCLIHYSISGNSYFKTAAHCFRHEQCRIGYEFDTEELTM